MIVNKFNYKKLDRTTDEYARHYISSTGYKLVSVTTVLDKTQSKEKREALEKWRSKTWNHKNITKRAANTGTIMHRKIEEHINNVIKSPGSNKGQQDGHNMAMTVINEGLCNVSEIWGMEISLYNSQLYAGTTDAIGLWKGNPAIIDFKQTNKPKKREWISDYFLQLVAYGECHDSMFNTKINTGVIMMCNNPDSYEPLKYQEFVLEGKEYNEYVIKWYDRLSEYYIKHG